ncbi:AP-2 complex subunit sigma [Lachnellula occidentalis]|uniref:AP-2 complex subunit sigma n=1 Tax=Lachnellula occidentalis TaxID=215460 RepID=A0A8H8RYM5_9HELO|nr:AP-2 complex subunit sigma [Lachnellula occidentalis]
MAIPASNGKTVLVTGIGGYIAGVLGHLLLTKGYSLRGTTRKAASLQPLLKGAYGPYADRVKIFEVPNMTVDGAFDEATKGVDGIFHTASPIDFSITTYDDSVTIAKRGNEVLLAAALKAGPQLTSVIVTSSVVAIIDPKEEPEYSYTEADWALGALAQAEKDKEAGVSTPSQRLYAASKTAADQTMWRFRDSHKPSFALTTINPALVMGPPANLVSCPSKLNATMAPLFSILSGTAKDIPPGIGPGSFVDVRDVAYEHLWAYENPSKADGQRYIACEGFGPEQAIADILRYAYKGTSIAEKIPVGVPGERYLGFDKETGDVGDVKYFPGMMRVDGSKAEREMGSRIIPISNIKTAHIPKPPATVEPHLPSPHTSTSSDHQRHPQRQFLQASFIANMVLSFILIQNRQGKTRLAKWYAPYNDEEKIKLKGEVRPRLFPLSQVHRLVAPRDQKYQSNFVEFRQNKIVYRRYAGLFFCACVDANDNELAFLEAIHFFVEVLDSFFGNVCELDLVFNFYKVYAILDEVFLAGEIEETSKQVVLTRLEHLDKLE